MSWNSCNQVLRLSRLARPLFLVCLINGAHAVPSAALDQRFLIKGADFKCLERHIDAYLVLNRRVTVIRLADCPNPNPLAGAVNIGPRSRGLGGVRELLVMRRRQLECIKAKKFNAEQKGDNVLLDLNAC